MVGTISLHLGSPRLEQQQSLAPRARQRDMQSLLRPLLSLRATLPDETSHFVFVGLREPRLSAEWPSPSCWQGPGGPGGSALVAAGPAAFPLCRSIVHPRRAMVHSSVHWSSREHHPVLQPCSDGEYQSWFYREAEPAQDGQSHAQGTEAWTESRQTDTGDGRMDGWTD